MQKRNSIILVCFLLLIVPASVFASNPREILTDYWPPYINQQNAPPGKAAMIIKITLKEMGLKPHWEYFPYDFSFTRIASDEDLLAFPFFKTEKRQQEVLFSIPLLKVNNYFYFNRQFRKFSTKPKTLQGLKIGRVAGYSYGEHFDAILKNSRSYATEVRALQALFNNQIDLLPMTQAVAKSLLKIHFPDRRKLILPLPGYKDKSALHLIASKTIEGEKFLTSFNATFSRLKKEGIFNALLAPPQGHEVTYDFATLVPCEGFPVITGQDSVTSSSPHYYALPVGTKVIVLQWSDTFKNPSRTDRLSRAITDLSLTLILNGPHAGKELYVKNMHIKIL